jgi:hypothetical protein
MTHNPLLYALTLILETAMPDEKQQEHAVMATNAQNTRRLRLA